MSAPVKSLGSYDLDDKPDPLWWAASVIWGLLTIFGVLSLVRWFDLFNPLTYVIFLVVGLLLSLRTVVFWLESGLDSPEPSPMSIRFSDTAEDQGKYSFQVYGKQKTRLGPRIATPKVGQLSYAVWWLAIRFPAFIGDRLLSLVWNIAGPRLAGMFYGGRSRRGGRGDPWGLRPSTRWSREPSMLEQARELEQLDRGARVRNTQVDDF